MVRLVWGLVGCIVLAGCANVVQAPVALSSDGKNIAVAHLQGLWIGPVGNERLVSKDGFDYPAWSPDSKMIALEEQVFVSHGIRERLPNGKRVVATESRDEGKGMLYDVATNRFSSLPQANGPFAWSEDGKFLFGVYRNPRLLSGRMDIFESDTKKRVSSVQLQSVPEKLVATVGPNFAGCLPKGICWTDAKGLHILDRRTPVGGLSWSRSQNKLIWVEAQPAKNLNFPSKFRAMACSLASGTVHRLMTFTTSDFGIEPVGTQKFPICVCYAMAPKDGRLAIATVLSSVPLEQLIKPNKASRVKTKNDTWPAFLVLIDPTSGEIRHQDLTLPSSGGLIANMVWSADGSTLAFEAGDQTRVIAIK